MFMFWVLASRWHDGTIMAPPLEAFFLTTRLIIQASILRVFVVLSRYDGPLKPWLRQTCADAF